MSAERPKALVSWSSGKDAAWTLHVLREQGELDVVGLLTSINEDAARVSMHAVREQLLELQAEAAGLPLWKVPLPNPCPNEEYERRMGEAVARARAEDIEVVAFGDLFLEDVRAYREKQLEGSGLRPVFPLWQRPTAPLSREMVGAGLRAIVTCVDPKQLDPSFVGRPWDGQMLDVLPEGVDPCGENGEMHTFVHDGPMLSHPVPVRVGEILERDGFWFADVVPEDYGPV